MQGRQGRGARLKGTGAAAINSLVEPRLLEKAWLREATAESHTPAHARSATMEDSPESHTLRKSAALLKNSINPDDIVFLLYDKELLTEGERNSANNVQLIATKRMREVYSALKRHVRVSPEAFHKFVRILISVCIEACGETTVRSIPERRRDSSGVCCAFRSTRTTHTRYT